MDQPFYNTISTWNTFKTEVQRIFLKSTSTFLKNSIKNLITKDSLLHDKYYEMFQSLVSNPFSPFLPGNQIRRNGWMPTPERRMVLTLERSTWRSIELVTKTQSVAELWNGTSTSYCASTPLLGRNLWYTLVVGFWALEMVKGNSERNVSISGAVKVAKHCIKVQSNSHLHEPCCQCWGHSRDRWDSSKLTCFGLVYVWTQVSLALSMPLVRNCIIKIVLPDEVK